MACRTAVGRTGVAVSKLSAQVARIVAARRQPRLQYCRQDGLLFGFEASPCKYGRLGADIAPSPGTDRYPLSPLLPRMTDTLPR